MTSQEPETLGTFNGHEIYPMPMFVTIAASDVAAVSDWYVRTLGFAVMFSNPMMVHLRRKKYQDILVVTASGGAALTITFQADDLDAVAAQAQAVDSSINGPVETPWNTRDLRVTDPEGNRLVFTSRNENASPEQVERMRKMLDAARSV